MKAKRAKSAIGKSGPTHSLNFDIPLWAWERLKQKRDHLAKVYGPYSMRRLILEDYCATLEPSPKEGKSIPSPLRMEGKTLSAGE